MNTPWGTSGSRTTPTTGARFRPYGLAVLSTLASVVLTRMTWPLFAPTPFFPVFAAVVVTTHWGTWRAGLASVGLATAGAALTFPLTGPQPWDPHTLVVFVMVAVLGSHVIASWDATAAALGASEAQLRATWEHATLGAALLDRSGRVERVNPALERLLGYPNEAASGMAFSAFSDFDDAAAERERFARFIAGTDAFYQREQRFRRHDGTILWGRVTVSVIRGGDRVPTGALAVIEDVTAQRQAEADLRGSEERLRRAQKMEAVGQLVAGVAHNFNNLLTVTMGYTDILLDGEHDPTRDQEAIREIRRATERGAALTRQLLAFGRKHDARLTRVDLGRTLSGLRDVLIRVIREDIQLTIDVGDGPLAVMIDPYDFEQVLLNLVINARDALPTGGSIHLDVAMERVGPATSGADPATASADYVRFLVRDNGIGMTPDVQSHLFEPFFTTKEVGQGTGLGLAFVHGIARHGGGFVTIVTAPGKGTTVAVYMPPAPTAAEATPAEPSAPTAEPARAPVGTILLVEDDDGVRAMTARMLVRAGYRVLPAALPGEAFTLFDRYREDIDLLLTDIVMPDMHGPVLAEKLVAKRPTLPVLFMSGYSETMPAGAINGGAVNFIAKPFSAAELVKTVAGLVLPASAQP